MGYVERLLIGIVLTITAYIYLFDSHSRNQFHLLMSHLHQKMQCCQYCYDCIEDIRIYFSAFLLTAAITLILDISILLSIISHLILIVLRISAFRFGSDYQDIQFVLTNAVLLFILIQNYKSNRKDNIDNKSQEESEKVQAVEAKPQPKVELKKNSSNESNSKNDKPAVKTEGKTGKKR